MIRQATDAFEPMQEYVHSLPRLADHVLSSGAVLFPGAFDQHGCHLVVFPMDGQAKLSSEVSKAEVVNLINYFLSLHNKKQEKETLVSVVADLRYASLPVTKFIAETLLLLEQHKRTVYSVYIAQPEKKDSLMLLQKLLTPSKSHAPSFKKVFVKEISELSNYIDQSQLIASLGGHLTYCHQSWVAFIKEIDSFVQEFVSVVQRLPSCMSALQAMSRLPLPTNFHELHHFCSTNEAKFQQFMRDLGLDKLLRHCECVVEKLRHPEMEPCYQAMAGTALFTHTAFEMFQNHSSIAAALEKVELLWQQAFSKACQHLQVCHLQEDALQITKQIETLLQEKLQPYKIEIAKDTAKGVMLVSQFEAFIHTPAMALVRCAEDVIHTLMEILQFDRRSVECWVLDLERLKDKLHSAVHFILQTLRAVCSYHHYYNKASSWYSLVICENFLQELLSDVNAECVPTHMQRRNWESIPAWRHKLSTFLKNNPPPDLEELLYMAHLSNVIPDDELQEAGKQISERVIDISLNDWDVKEQESLTEVEMILDRADEILEEEENVLAPEVVLETPLKSEVNHNQWPQWNSEGSESNCKMQDLWMSSSKLTEAEELGLENYLDPANSDISDSRSAGSVSDNKTFKDEGHCTEVAAPLGKPDMVTELRKVCVLNELIVEENLKIYELLQCEENFTSKLSWNKPSNNNWPFSVREAFWLELEENQELEKCDEVKKHKQSARNVVKCSIMGMAKIAEEDEALTDELLSNTFNVSQRTHSKPVDEEDTCNTENIQGESGPNLAEDATPHDAVPQYQNIMYFKANPTISNRVTSDFKKTSEEVGIPPTGCFYGKEFNSSCQNAMIYKAEFFLTPEMRLDDGSNLLSVPEPRKTSPVNNLREHSISYDTEQFNTHLFLSTQHLEVEQLDLHDKPPNALQFVLNTNIKEHNNNHPEKYGLSSDQLSEITTKDEEDTSLVPVCLLRADVQLIMDIQTASPMFHCPHQQSVPQPSPDHPLEFDPGGRRELNDLHDDMQRFEAMRISCSGSSGIQAKINNMREITDFKTPIVLDSGSGFMKAVYANQDIPSIIIGVPKHEEIMNGNIVRETYIGHEALQMRGVLALHRPVKTGIISNWDEMEKLLQEQGLSLHTTVEVEIAREMKKCCCVALNYEAELTWRSSSTEMHYTMPDGQIVTLGIEWFRPPEIVFKPELIEWKHYGMHEKIFNSVLCSDIDLWHCFLRDIVLSGGNTLLPGLPERLQAEIKRLVPATFSSAWISQEEYEVWAADCLQEVLLR